MSPLYKKSRKITGARIFYCGKGKTAFRDHSSVMIFTCRSGWENKDQTMVLGAVRAGGVQHAR